MYLLSSFELIVQPIVPSIIAPSLGMPNPVAVQAYFLLLSNPTEQSALIQLDFTANFTDGATTFNGGGIIPTGGDNFQPVSSFINLVGFSSLLPTPGFIINSDSSARANFSVPALGTALFLLQPDVSPLTNFDEKTDSFSYELRGYVEINATSGVKLLCSPQVRGTFFDLGKKGELLAPMILQPEAKKIPAEEAQVKLSVYSQQTYPLQIVTKSLYEF